MLIVFIAFVAMFDAILSGIKPALLALHVLKPENVPEWMNNLKLGTIFGWVFSPVAFLMGVAWDDAKQVGSLLGTKLSINEHVAYLQMKNVLPVYDSAGQLVQTASHLSERSAQLAAFALTGFANFSSVGIQLGGIGGMAPKRRHDLARLGMRALFVGFTATLLNASIAGILLPEVVEPTHSAAAPESPKAPVPETPATTPADAPDQKPLEPAKPAATGDKSSTSLFTRPSQIASADVGRQFDGFEVVDFVDRQDFNLLFPDQATYGAVVERKRIESGRHLEQRFEGPGQCAAVRDNQHLAVAGFANRVECRAGTLHQRAA
jgi:Na+ dependent nucleoside transporter C-terminus